jgi:hypothetical protein
MTVHKPQTLTRLAALSKKYPGLTMEELKGKLRAERRNSLRQQSRTGRRGAANISVVGGIAFVAVVAGGLFYAIKTGATKDIDMNAIKQAIIETGTDLALSEASSRLLGVRGALLLDMAFSLKSCNGAADDEREAVIEFLVKNFPDAMQKKDWFTGAVTYSLKPGNEKLYEEAKEFLKNAKRLEVELPQPAYDPCRGSDGGSGASASGSCN